MSETSPEPVPVGPRTPRESVEAMRIHAPTERNPKLGRFLENANANVKLKARWLGQQVTADRLEMSDHSWVHLQIVLNRALHLFRLLHRSGLKASIETDYAMSHKDAEVIIAGGCLLHDLGMSIHRNGHEEFSLFLAADLLDDLLGDVYADPERTVIASEILHAIIGHRKDGRPLTFEAGGVRVADALDMEDGRSRGDVETSLANIHSLSGGAVDEGRVIPGRQRRGGGGGPMDKSA